MNGSIVAYRNPLEMWFWEGGWVYITAFVVLAVLLIWALLEWEERKAKQRRKQRWLEMNEAQRASWRYYNQRNNFEAQEWEKK